MWTYISRAGSALAINYSWITCRVLKNVYLRTLVIILLFVRLLLRHSFFTYNALVVAGSGNKNDFPCREEEEEFTIVVLFV